MLTSELRKGSKVQIRHEAGLEVGTVTGWTHSDRYGDRPLVSIDWADGTNSSVSIDWIIGEIRDEIRPGSKVQIDGRGDVWIVEEIRDSGYVVLWGTGPFAGQYGAQIERLSLAVSK